MGMDEDLGKTCTVIIEEDLFQAPVYCKPFIQVHSKVVAKFSEDSTLF